MQMLKNIW